MHERLIAYLRDNRDQIIENWLTETEIPAPDTDPEFGDCGVVPLAFFNHAFDAVVALIQGGRLPESPEGAIRLNDFLGITGSCRQRCIGGRVCIELHEAGLKAFLSVFAEDWDIENEFNALDRECCADRINHALSGVFAREIESCNARRFRSDCPFVAHFHTDVPHTS